MKVFWWLAIIGAVAGAFGLVATWAANGAPQQAAGAAIAVALAVLPYCLARAVEGIRGERELIKTAASFATKLCPDCAESVREEARKCRFCGFDFRAPQGETCKACHKPLDRTISKNFCADCGAPC